MLSQEFGYDCPRLVSTGDISLDISHFSAQQHKLDISPHLTIFHVWDDSAIAKRTQAVPRPEDWSRLPGRPRIIWLKTVLDDLQLHNLTLSVLMVVFPGGPGFSRWTSRYQNLSILDFIRAKDEGGGGDNWSYKK